jgi:hypothetical protein
MSLVFALGFGTLPRSKLPVTLLKTNLISGAHTLILMVVILFGIKASRSNCVGSASYID